VPGEGALTGAALFRKLNALTVLVVRLLLAPLYRAPTAASPDGTHYLSRSLSISARRKASLRRDGVRCPTTVDLGSL
jgi:hypothetical protein